MMKRDSGHLPYRSERIFRFFRHYNNWYLGRSFHALRILRSAGPPDGDRPPSLFYLNHPGWWDPLVCVKLIDLFWPSTEHYAPIEREQLDQYAIFSYLGFFGVRPDSAASHRRFLRVAETILDRDWASLWLTPQGRFADPRERPLAFQSGLAHLAARASAGRICPVAVHYSFWENPRPEILVGFGTPINLSEIDSSDRNDRLETGLEAVLDRLLEADRERCPDAFTTYMTETSLLGELRAYGTGTPSAERRNTGS